MKIYGLSGLNEEIKQSEHYKGKTPKQQYLILVRCNVFIHIIHQNNMSKKSLKMYTQVGLSSTFLSKTLGSGYKQILKILKEIDIINMDPWLINRRRKKVELEDDYYYLPNLKKYWLTNKAKNCTVEEIELKNTKYEQKVTKILELNNLDSEIRFNYTTVEDDSPKLKSRPLF